MNDPTPPPILPEPVPSTDKVLRRLFLTLFLRGRGARGLNRQGTPKSIGEKLALTLVFYALFGCITITFLHQPVFALAVYLHAMTFLFLGMFVASSAGEVLFNKEEGDILMHRPVTSKQLLWAKVRVLIEVSLWLAGAFNLAGLFVGFAGDDNWRFPIVHIFSTILEALFCTGCVVLAYQLCLRWFGRERLDGVMTSAQVLISVAAVLSGQILPRVMFKFNHVLTVGESSWWIAFLPPAWFAGFDDAFAGTAALDSWLLALLAVVVTATVLWLAFGKLARDYETGLQALNETVSKPAKKQNHGPWLDRLVNVPPLSWWLRDPVERASFLLASAYLLRDRDVKLRIYPGLAPIIILPFVFLFQNHHQSRPGESNFGIPMAGVFLGLVPLLALQILQYSQQWQAADVFRLAPMVGPAQICHGARRAVICLLTLPLLVLVGLIVWLLTRDVSQLILFLPGLIALPVFALFPSLTGKGLPLSEPADAAKAAGRSLNMIGVMAIAVGLAAITDLAQSKGWFWWLILGEIVMAVPIYFILRAVVDRKRWESAE